MASWESLTLGLLAEEGNCDRGGCAALPNCLNAFCTGSFLRRSKVLVASGCRIICWKGLGNCSCCCAVTGASAGFGAGAGWPKCCSITPIFSSAALHGLFCLDRFAGLTCCTSSVVSLRFPPEREPKAAHAPENSPFIADCAKLSYRRRQLRRDIRNSNRGAPCWRMTNQRANGRPIHHEHVHVALLARHVDVTHFAAFDS